MKKRIDPGYLISLLLSVVLAFVIGAVILAIAGFSPGKAYLAMLNGAFSSARHIGDALPVRSGLRARRARRHLQCRR